MSRRLVFLGTPDMAVPPLQALRAAGHDIALVVSQPDRRRGRGGALTPSPVKQAALDLGLPVTDRVDDLLDLHAEHPIDLGVVVAFGRLIKRHVLDAVPMINAHFSLLPRWRGAAPVERALLAGDDVTGVCIMALEETLDTGSVYARAEVPITAVVTAAQLRMQLVDLASDLLVDVLAAPNLPPAVPQVGQPTYAAKFDPGEWELDWSEPATVVDRWIRAGNAWTTFRDKRLRVHSAKPGPSDDLGDHDADPGMLLSPDGHVATGSGIITLVTVQPEGKAAMAWREFANGAQPQAGERMTRRDQ